MDALRKPKVFDMAVFDLAATLAVATVFTTHRSVINIGTTFIVLMCLAIIVHVIFKIPTRLNAYLGLVTVDEVYEAREKTTAIEPAPPPS